jgi:2',3'-cyclic-nucleotide 2'-phosphodiesterase (5'-nucleotidase family)
MKITRHFSARLFFLAICAMMLGAASPRAWSATIGWNFTDLNAAFDTGTPDNFSVGGMSIANSFGTVATPIAATSVSGSYTGASGGGNIGNAVNNATFSTATSPYTTVTFTPAAGYSLQISHCDFGMRSTATGATLYALYSSVDNYTTPVMTGSNAANSTWTLKTNAAFTLNGATDTPITLRLYTYGGASNAGSGTINTRLDDIAITVAAVAGTSTNPAATAGANPSAVAPGDSVTLTVTVTPGANPASSGLSVTGDLSAIGGSASQTLTAGPNNTFTYSATVPANASYGVKHLAFTVQDAQSRTGSATLDLSVRSNLTIFHTNDTHARVTPHKWIVPKHGTDTAPDFEDVGGIAYLGAKVISLATGTPDALVLDGGDISEGNPIGDWNGPGFATGTYGNQTIVDYFKMLDTKLKAIPGRGGRGLDAMVVGNHDIRDISYINNMKAASAQFPILSINICNKGTHTPYFQPYTIVNINGNKVGIVGYTTESADSPETDVNNLIDVVPCDWDGTGTDKIHFSSIVNDLRNNQGCTMVILLTHMGHSGLCTVTGANPTPILVDNASGRVPEVVVSGHWHTYCDTVWQPTSLNYKTIFTEAGSFQHYVGELKVNGAGKYLSSTYYPLQNSQITPDPDIASYLQTRKDQYAQATPPPPYGVDQIIGYSSDDLLLDNYMKWWSADEYPWSGNNTAGNWICDAVQAKAAQLFGSCDLSVEAGGGVRSDIVAGPITYTNIYETFPWPDDTIYVVHMTGQQIWNFFKDHNCDAALSSAWHVTAFDGNPTSITYNGQPVNLTQTYTVAINNYMYLHDTSNFAAIDPNPLTSSYLARTALFDYTSQFGQGNPYDAGASRYTLNTDFSGGYRAVVTMMNDHDSSESFKDGFIRFIGALPETLAHRGTQQVPTDLVNADGTMNRANRLTENEWYRSYLGFRADVLHPGDIVEIWGKGAFFGGNPEFVDQEGIQSDGVEFKIVGHDTSLALPTYFSSISGFWNEVYKNHYVKFVAKKTGTSTVTDKSGTTITVQDATGFATKTLPGNVGDLLVITGVPTSESFALRFRADNAVLASTQGITDYPPDSHVDALTTEQTNPTLSLSATATVAPGSNQNFYTLEPVADAQVESGVPGSNFGTTTNIFIESAATGTFQNERGWLRFDLSSIPASSTISSATLNMFCWKTTGASLPVGAYPGDTDTWTETGITFSTQPTFGAAVDTKTLVAGATNVWYSWDATNFVQTKYAGNKLVSLMVKAVTEDSPDATAPSYGFDAKEFTANHPYLQVVTPATGPQTTLTQVQFFYRYSADNQTWGSWNSFQTASTAPYTANFSYPNGYGYYEFYSAATDSNGNVEPVAPYGDAAVHFTPGPITSTPTNVTPSGATLGGSFNPYGVQTSIHFEYGTDTNYGNSTATQDIGSGNGIVNFNTPLAGLQAGTLYHVRAVIVANGVTTYGTDQTFTTAQDVPAMPGWAWITLGGALVIVAATRLPRHRKASVLTQA